MLYLYTNSDQNLAVNDNVAFKEIGLISRGPVKQRTETVISLTSPGIYEINFFGDAANNTGTAGEVAVQLYVNGVEYNGARATSTSESLSDVVNLDFAALVKVKPNCCILQDNVPTVITIKNVGLASIFANAEIIVKRVG